MIDWTKWKLVPVEPTQAMLDAAGMCEYTEGKRWIDTVTRGDWEAMLAAAPSAPGMVTREELARADEKIEAQRDSLREHMAMVRERDTEITTLRARIAELERDAARVDTDGHPLVLIRREIVENFARSTNVPRFRRICESALAASDKAMEAGK